jgi:hypothetical protein
MNDPPNDAGPHRTVKSCPHLASEASSYSISTGRFSIISHLLRIFCSIL